LGLRADIRRGGRSGPPSAVPGNQNSIASANGLIKSRLTKIERDGEAVDYAYDRFGGVTQDGDLSNGYDDKGGVRRSDILAV
jgi:hypothetical protein